MKIYDCTIFFDEKMMFDLRLNILNDYVDKFVVAEFFLPTVEIEKNKTLILTIILNLKTKLYIFL